MQRLSELHAQPFAASQCIVHAHSSARPQRMPVLSRLSVRAPITCIVFLEPHKSLGFSNKRTGSAVMFLLTRAWNKVDPSFRSLKTLEFKLAVNNPRFPLSGYCLCQLAALTFIRRTHSD